MYIFLHTYYIYTLSFHEFDTCLPHLIPIEEGKKSVSLQYSSSQHLESIAFEFLATSEGVGGLSVGVAGGAAI